MPAPTFPAIDLKPRAREVLLALVRHAGDESDEVIYEPEKRGRMFVAGLHVNRSTMYELANAGLVEWGARFVLVTDLGRIEARRAPSGRNIEGLLGHANARRRADS